MKEKMFQVTLIFCLFIFMPLTFAIANETEDSEIEVEIMSTSLFLISAQDLIYQYSTNELGALIKDEPSNPTAIFSSIEQISSDGAVSQPELLANKQLAFFFLPDNQVLDSLTDSDLTLLADLVHSGATVGIFDNNTAHLREKLGILSDEIGDIANDASDSNQISLLYAKGGGVQEISFPIDEMTAGEMVSEIGEWILETIYETAAQQDKAGGAWDATYTRQWKGNMSGGSYRFLVNVFKLETQNKKNDWYLLTTSMTSTINDYSCSDWGTRCGWYTSEQDLTVQVKDDGSLYEYMPTGTISGGSKGFSIGGDLSAGIDTSGPSAGGTLSGSYSESYNFSDITIIDKSDFVKNKATWTIAFSQPNYTWYPWITAPPNTSRNTYTWDPALIVETPKGKPVKVTMTPTITHSKDSLKYYFFALSVSRSTSTWNPPLSLSVK